MGSTRKTGRSVGRPSGLTDEVRAKLLQALEVGATHRIAAQFAGVHVSTLQAWLAENREFSDAAKLSESKASIMSLAAIRTAAQGGQWQAGAWLLERRYPEEYGRRQVEVIGQGGGPVQVQAQIVVVPARAISVQDWTATVRAPDAIPGPDAMDKDGDA